MFVLDSSGSIGAENFTKVKEYVHNYTESLLSGGADSRIGVIQYSNSASVDIDLDFLTNSTQERLLEEIGNLPYLSQATNTPEGLCLLKSRPWRQDVSVLRIAIVLTDGMSNQDSTSCNTSNGDMGTVNSTAQEVHSFRPPITVFSVGVANYVEEELNIIATNPYLVDRLESFDNRLLLQNQQAGTYFICFRGKHKPFINFI